jgi:hypothetical protein
MRAPSYFSKRLCFKIALLWFLAITTSCSLLNRNIDYEQEISSVEEPFTLKVLNDRWEGSDFTVKARLFSRVNYPTSKIRAKMKLLNGAKVDSTKEWTLSQLITDTQVVEPSRTYDFELAEISDGFSSYQLELGWGESQPKAELKQLAKQDEIEPAKPNLEPLNKQALTPSNNTNLNNVFTSNIKENPLQLSLRNNTLLQINCSAGSGCGRRMDVLIEVSNRSNSAVCKGVKVNIGIVKGSEPNVELEGIPESGDKEIKLENLKLNSGDSQLIRFTYSTLLPESGEYSPKISSWACLKIK